MNDIERDLRRRLKKSIRKRTELNNRVLEYQKEKQELIDYLKEQIIKCDKDIKIHKKEKQELIEYLKEQINECKLTGNDEDYIKKDVYEEILSKIEKR